MKQQRVKLIHNKESWETKHIKIWLPNSIQNDLRLGKRSTFIQSTMNEFLRKRYKEIAKTWFNKFSKNNLISQYISINTRLVTQSVYNVFLKPIISPKRHNFFSRAPPLSSLRLFNKMMKECLNRHSWLQQIASGQNRISSRFQAGSTNRLDFSKAESTPNFRNNCSMIL